MAHDTNLSPEEKHKAKMKTIVMVTLILSGVTFVEFALAFLMDAGIARTTIFFVLTFAKAYYIIAEFMHLGHEVPSLKRSIIFPLIFVVWLIAVLLWEGSVIFDMRTIFDLF